MVAHLNYTDTTHISIASLFRHSKVSLTFACLQRAYALLTERVQTRQKFRTPISHVLLARAASWHQTPEVFARSRAVRWGRFCRQARRRFGFHRRRLLARDRRHFHSFRALFLTLQTFTSGQPRFECRLIWPSCRHNGRRWYSVLTEMVGSSEKSPLRLPASHRQQQNSDFFRLNSFGMRSAVNFAGGLIAPHWYLG